MSDMKRLATTILILLTACGERDEALPNGYRFIELSRGNGAITKGGDSLSIRTSSSIGSEETLFLGSVR
jgi:hypothetical protein